MTDITNILRQYFPQWMAIRNDDKSVGAQFLESFGLQLTDLENYLNELLVNQFAGTANLGEVDIIYKAYIQAAVMSDGILAVTDDKGNPITVYDRLDKFYSTSENGAVMDLDTEALYIRKNYRTVNNQKEYFDKIYANGIVYGIELHHVWNAFDEFGLLVGIYRIEGEDNTNFKRRILDVFKNPPGSSIPGLKNHISRVLDISKDNVEIKPLSVLADTEIDIHGNVSPKFMSYIETLNRLIPFTWDVMRWDEGYWDMFSTIGLDYLPHIYNPDTSMWKGEEFQSGIGDNEDLVIGPPTKEPPAKTFKYKVGLTGTIDRSEDVFVEHDLQFRIHATGYKTLGDKLPKKAYHTVVASEEVPFSYDVGGYKLYDRHNTEGFGSDPALTYEISNIDIVPGNQIMSANNKFLKARIKLSTNDGAKTPKLKSVAIRWYDTSYVLNTVTLDTAEDLTRNDEATSYDYPIVNTDLNSCQTQGEGTDGYVEIGKGDYSRYYDTMNSWKDGVRQDVRPTRAGLKMVLPQERGNY